MEERLRFVARRLEGKPTALCREFGISRKTGHKLFARWKNHGLEAIADRPRPPGARFDAFVETFNAARPHEALATTTPEDRYTASPRLT